MTMLAIILPALAAITATVCGLISHRHDTDAFKSLAELLVKDSAPKDRPDVVRALAELVTQLRGERKRATIMELLLNRFQRGQPNG
jgi:hypothetical protein